MSFFIDEVEVTAEVAEAKFKELEVLFDNVFLCVVPSKGNTIILEKLLLEKMGAKK